MRHPEYFFGQSPEHAIIDPENPYVLASHLRCAAFELPLREQDSESFGGHTCDIAGILEESGELKQIDRAWYWSSTDFPAASVNLRTISENTFTIVEMANGQWPEMANGQWSMVNEPQTRQPSPTNHQPSTINHSPSPLPHQPSTINHQPFRRVIGQVDAISAPELVYPQAVYMHEAETYFVEGLDLVNRVAYVRRADVDYYTQAILDASIRIGHGEMVNGQGSMADGQWSMDDERTSSRSLAIGHQPSAIDHPPSAIDHQPSAILHLGPATVTWATTGFKKIKFYSLDSIGYGKVDIPPQHLETMAMWIVPPEELLEGVRRAGRNPVEGLVGIRNMIVHVLPLFAMCDKQDIGGIVDSSNTGTPTIFIYDRYPGGLGFAEKGFEMAEEVLRACLRMVEECGCEDGCPSCVGIPVLRPAIHQDPDIFGAFPIPDKSAALLLLKGMVG
jgi:DEAD/DEAH box helicase domain-containing protein